MAAGSVAALSTVGTVSAARRTHGLSKQKVNKAFHRGIIQDGAAGARANLEDLGIEDPTVKSHNDFSVQTDPETLAEETDDAGRVSPEYKYGDPENTDSKLYVSQHNVDGSDDKVRVSVGMALRDQKLTAGHAFWCDDAIGVGYNNSDWAPVGNPVVRASKDHSARFTSDDVGDDALAGTVNIKDHYEVDGQQTSLPSATATLSGVFRLRDGKVPSTLWGSYNHTLSISPSGAISDISGGKGGISVGLNTEARKAWSIADSVDPRNELPGY
ncbi:hypothetical protein IL252_06135 [Halomicrobium sp. IBSBa]|uniref:hypothetical protein n=1 Tax=Halomicrobium sp. IBSBa TaxID=2778916 RepID=UPI001ABEF4FE|nr:hypothetical protein [Halomicrobium sp. IBSBa]MBO4247401.1 hypothetical protein [Halomicrobium sp. IBSBa]